MEFFDEEVRQAAARTAQRAVTTGASALLMSLVMAPLFSLFIHPLAGVAMVVLAIFFGASSISTLRHPQAVVIGALRIVGFALSGAALLVATIEIVVVGLQYTVMRHNAELIENANQRVH
jgi:hypothetical protein